MRISLSDLSSSVLIAVSGKDAERYLNNRLSNDIKNLAVDGDGIFAAALSVQGKAEAFMSVFKRAEQNYLLLCDGGDSQEILKSIARYKVTEKVSFELLSQYQKAYHLFPASMCKKLLEDLRLQCSQEKTTISKRNRFGEVGFDVVVPANIDLRNLVSSAVAEYEELSDSAQNIKRSKACIPQFPSEISPNYLLQESNLLASFSVLKGCYVGQEVIQKIASFAALPFQLFAFRAEGMILSTEIVTAQTAPGIKLGSLTSCAYDEVENRSYGFIRIKLKAEAALLAMLYIGGKKLEISPIHDFTADI